MKNEATIVLGQRKLFQRLVPGVMHALIFWGFLVLFPTIVMAMIGAVSRGASLPWSYIMTFALALTVVLVCSRVFYMLFERPFIKLRG